MDKKYIILIALIITSISLSIANSIYSYKAKETKELYISTQESIQEITQISNKYREKDVNRRLMMNFLDKYKQYAKSQIFNKNDVEFMLGDLKDNILNDVIKELIEKDFQIAKMEIKRATPHIAQINVKVKF